jgi:hypothetical protein
MDDNKECTSVLNLHQEDAEALQAIVAEVSADGGTSAAARFPRFSQIVRAPQESQLQT